MFHADGQPRAGRPRILSVGRLVERKGFEDLIRAMTLVPAAECVIIGGTESQPYARKLRDLAGNAPDQDSVLAAAELAGFYCDEGRWDEAAELLAYSRDVAHRWHLTQHLVRARLAAHLGEHADALALIGPVVERADRAGFLTMRGHVQATLAEVHRAAGNLAEADAAAAAAVALYEQKGNVAAAERVRAAVTA